MATFLFDKIIFGPVYSRRLGVSLGINLLPNNRKICNFDCIYCECGLTHTASLSNEKMPSREQVRNALYQTLEDMAASDQEDPDVITFAGNGEPTIHPEIAGIIDDTIEVKNVFFPEAKVAMLTNSTTIMIPEVREALKKVDKCILKLDSAIDNTLQLHNRPATKIIAEQLIDSLAGLDFDIIIQTMFIRGTIDGRQIDNTTEQELDAWIRAIEKIKPSEVQIYTISRDAPKGHDISKVESETLHSIAEKINSLGISTRVSA
jgi:wyosine [tRNA(Phe)-imidazoG37] synthetase (radical SAM superfamily)